MRRIAERGEDADHQNICSKNAKADGCDDGSEEDDGHKKRNHNYPTLKFSFFLRAILQSTRIDALR
jgi:hypothetical protein